MTSAPVKDVRNILDNLTSSKPSGTKNDGKASFQDVWNRQTAGNNPNAGNDTQSAQKVTRNVKQETDSSVQPENVSNAGEKLQDSEFQDKDIITEALEDGELSEEELTAIMEILNSTIASFATEVAQTLGISMDELKSVLGRLGMSELDLLQPDALTQVAMEVNQEADVMSLLTNGELYQDVQNLSNKLQQVLQDCSRKLQMKEGDFNNLLDQIEAALQPEEALKKMEPAPELPLAPDEADVVMVKKEDTAQPVKQTDSLQTSGESNVPEVKTQLPLKEKNSSDHGRQDSTGSRGNEGNPFIQNLKEIFTAGNKVNTEAVQTSQGNDTEAIMRQIMDYMKIQTKSEMSSLEMQLHPENLGSLQIQLSSKGGNITAQFITQSDTVKTAIESQMVQLKENFAQQGIKVEAVEVTVQPHAFERNLDQGGGRGQEESGKKGRARKIDLGRLEETDDMTEAEQITADIMAANGNTVDYTV